MGDAALRRMLFEIRRRRGRYANEPTRAAEIARLRSRLRPGSPEAAVFEAVEVQGLTFKAAAAHIGFSERQLYRVRQVLFERLESVAVQRIAVAPLASAERQLDLAESLFVRGHPSDAAPILEGLLDSAETPRFAIETLTLQSRVLCDLEQEDAAAQALDEARNVLHALGEDAPGDLQRDVLMAESYRAYRNGYFDESIPIAERALADHARTPLADPYAARALARHLIFLGVQHQEGGSPAMSLSHLQSAARTLNALPSAPAGEVAQIALHSAFARAAIPGQLAQARSDARDALRRAEWHGLVYEIVWANLALAMIEEVSGDAQAGLPHAHTALTLARNALRGDPLTRTLFVTSRLEAAVGRQADALRRVHEADEYAGKGGLLRSVYHVCEARIRRDAGKSSETIAAASRAIAAMEAKSRSHLIGIPYLARAVARRRLGDPAAYDDVEAALAYLERGGSVKDLSLALQLSYELTGNRAHASRAREIQAACG